MGVGLGVVLLAVGLILALAVGDSVEGVDLVLVGWILAGAGVLALVVGLVMNAQRSRRSVDKTVHTD
jgi:membrane protein implicated in regulation of membrane protease activity